MPDTPNLSLVPPAKRNPVQLRLDLRRRPMRVTPLNIRPAPKPPAGWADPMVKRSDRTLEAPIAKVIELPSFPPRTLFFEVEGDAVSFASGKARRWINGKPSPFSATSAAHGALISEADFRVLAKKVWP
jgi:hypothetical protein